MHLPKDIVLGVFSIASAIFGVIGLVTGKLTVGIEGSDDYNRELTGASAKFVSITLLCAAVVLPINHVLGFLILFSSIVLGWWFSK